MSTLEDFAKLVRTMRRAQKAYFNLNRQMRTVADLEEARRLEREVDGAVRKVLPPEAARGPLPGQGTLFDDEENIR